MSKIIDDGISAIIPEEFLDRIPCMIPYSDVFYYFLLPILIGIALLIILKFLPIFKEKFMGYLGKKGYIRIFFILSNKRLIPKYVKLDKFNNFKLGKRLYNLEKMQNYVIGYDKRNFPIFMFDNNFILPLTITKEKMTKEIKKQLNVTDIDTISAVSMKLDSQILRTVYDKKLISDLYNVSMDSDFKQKLIWVALILLALVIAYYTGLLQKIFNFLGIKGV